jgi:hypothetical protein
VADLRRDRSPGRPPMFQSIAERPSSASPKAPEMPEQATLCPQAISATHGPCRTPSAARPRSISRNRPISFSS